MRHGYEAPADLPMNNDPTTHIPREETGIARRLTALRGLRMFFLMWSSQLVSALGSSLTGFALGLWVYQRTGSITEFALIAFFVTLPGILVSPLVGTLVDRWDVRRVLILSDLCNGLTTSIIAVLLFTNMLATWQIYLTTALGSLCLAFQWTAYTVAVSRLVPSSQLARMNGISQLVPVSSTLLAPALAGILLPRIELRGIIIIDLVTFVLAFVIMALLVRLPGRSPTSEQRPERGALLREAREGWLFIKSRPGLVGLLPILALMNFNGAVVEVLITPLVLSFTDATTLGLILSGGGSGMLLGSLAITVWGGPRRRIYGVFGFVLLQGLVLLLGGLKPNVPLVMGAIFVYLFCEPIVASCNLAIWQSKIAPELQGRVLAIRRLLSFILVPLAYLVVGPLTSRVMEPLLAVDGALAGTLLGRMIGVGTGRGIGLLFMLLGFSTMLLAIIGVSYRPLRTVEQDLPDVQHEAGRTRQQDPAVDRPATPHAEL